MGGVELSWLELGRVGWSLVRLGWVGLQTELKPEKMFAGILQRERMEREKEARIIHDHLTDFRFVKFEIV